MNTGMRSLLSRFSLLIVLFAWLLAHGVAHASPPYKYYILSPEPLSGPLSVMSLAPNNIITVDGTQQLTLQEYDTATIPSSAFTSGSVVSGSGFYTLSSSQAAADLPVPADFAGTSFVVPQIAGSHSYFFLSPAGTATVTFQVGANTYTTTAQPGVVNEYDAGSDNTVAARITSDVPILVAHTAYLSGAARDAFPVAPASTDTWGVRSQSVVVAALQDGTSVTAYASDGTSATYSLNAGAMATLAAGAGTAQGQGSAVHITSNAPIAAVQYGDGDGNDATTFWPSGSFGRRYGVPINTQYIAVACNQSSTSVTLYKGVNAPETQTCSGSSTTPGKVYFGSSTSGANIPAGWYFIASNPVFAMYEAAASEGEHNTLGVVPVAPPAAPTLGTVASPTSNNPQTVTGTAGANQSVLLYVNGKLQATTTASSGGSFSFNAALLDGSNTFYATAVSGTVESDPSNAITVQYVNNIPRNQSGTITGTVVWTPGSPAQAYTVTTADLVVASGAQLILQPGATIQFSSGRTLTVNGVLTVKGTSTSNVTFTSNSASPTRGAWNGIVLNGATASGSSISNALVEWANTAVDVNGATGVTVSGSTIRNFSSYGIHVRNAGNATITGNVITNVSGANATCLYANATSPTIQGNTISFCNTGLYLTGAANPTVTQGNTITSNSYGFYIAGSGTATTQPIPVVSNNNIYNNNSYNVFTSSYVNGATTKLNFQQNSWGSTAPAAIGSSIYDYTDDPSDSHPFVDHSNYLSGLNGQPVPGNYLTGTLTAGATLTAGTTYDVMGMLIVPSGQTLTVPAGAVLHFYDTNAALLVNGTLNVQGTTANPVTITSGNPTPAKGAWVGIVLNGSTANGSAISNALVEWANTGLDINGATGVTISNSTIRNFYSYGMQVRNSGNATITGNVITNTSGFGGTCLNVNATSPTLQGNTLSFCSTGLNLTGAASPMTQGNTITNTSYGVSLQGNGSATTQPNPVVNGNNIYGNSVFNVYTTSYVNGATTKLNFQRNWWGSTAPAIIGSLILDYTDQQTASYPVVDYSNYLNGLNGQPVAGNYLMGTLTAGATLTAGTTYDVMGLLVVPSGQTLTVPGGVVLRFYDANSQLLVNGTLNVQGTAANPVTITSGNATPAKGAWIGIVLNGSAANGSSISNALVEWANGGVDINGATGVTISNSTIRNFVNFGIQVRNSGNATITGNLITNTTGVSGYCLNVNATSPTLQGNTVSFCGTGLNLTGAANPTVTQGNTITNNNYGISLQGNGSAATQPNPVVNGNNIFGSASSFNVYAGGYVNAPAIKLNFQQNWWGTAVPTAIRAGLADYTWNPDSGFAVIDYSNFLDGPGGNVVAGNYLLGSLPASTALTAGTTYDVLADLIVPSGMTLTVPAGVVLKFSGPTTRLIVDGTLSIQGTSAARVILTSGLGDPARGSWYGVDVRATAANVAINYAVIDWATIAVNVTGTNATISNSWIRNFSSAGIQMTNATAGSQISGNYIDNHNQGGYGINLTASSPSIAGNQIIGTSYGVYLSGASNPSITGNTLTGNTYGLYLYGAGSNIATAVPNPVITGNDIFGNFNGQLVMTSYGASNAVVINATGNWWGTATPQTGQQIQLSGGTPTTVVNFTSPAAGPLTGVATASVGVSPAYFSPNGDGIQDTTTISGTLSQSGGWTLTIRDPSGTVIRTYSGSGTSVSVTWDGKNSGGQVTSDAAYGIEVTVSGAANPSGTTRVVLDDTAPATVITNPVNGALTNSLTVPVVGTANDTYFVSYTLEYGSGTNPTTWTSIASQTTAVSQGSLGTWIVNTTNGSTALPNGPYVLRLRASDKAGNTSSALVPVTLDNLSITSVSPSASVFQPLSGQLQVNFTLGGPATTYLRIYSDLTGALIREIRQDFAAGGAQALSWDGKDASGNYLPDEAYDYVIYATDGTRSGTYDIPAPSAANSQNDGTVVSTFNAYRNVFWKMTDYHTSGGRVRGQVTGCTSAAIFPFSKMSPLPAGTSTLMWDGRDANGQLVTGTCAFYFDVPLPVKPSSVVMKGTVPVITGTGVAPNVEVQSTPWLITHSYEQIARITYRVSQDSYVTVKLLPPGVADPTSPQAIVLVSNELDAALNGSQPANHTVEWRGYDPDHTNNILVSAEGGYTFAIQATSVQTGQQALYRGVLQLYQ